MHKLCSQAVASWFTSQRKRLSKASTKRTTEPSIIARCVCQNPSKSEPVEGPMFLTSLQRIQFKHLKKTLQVTLQDIETLLGTARLTTEANVAADLGSGNIADNTLEDQQAKLPQPAIPSPLASDRFSEDGTVVQDEFELGIEAVWSLLKNLADLVSFCSGLWDRLDEKRQDIYTTCVVTNIAIQEMQMLHNKFVNAHPHLDTAEAVHRYLGVTITMTGGRWRMVAQRRDIRERGLPDLLNPPHYAYLKGWLDTTSGAYGPQGIDTQRLHSTHDRITLALCSVYRMIKSGIGMRQQDCLIDGMVTSIAKKVIPIWLPSALAAYAQIFDRFPTSAGIAWTIQEEVLEQKVFDIENLVTTRREISSARHLDRIVKSCKNLLKARNEAASLWTSLQHFPVAACAIGYQIKVDAYLGSLSYCKERSHLSIVARIYGQCVKSNLLSVSWQDIEYILDQHKESKSCPAVLAIALSPTKSAGSIEIPRDSAEAFDGCIHDDLRLKPPAILARIFDVSKSNPVSEFWQKCREEVRQPEKDYQSPILDLEQLTDLLQEQEQELAFDYLWMAYNCETIVRAIQRAYGFETLDEVESTLLLRAARSPVGSPSHPLTKSASILEDFIARSGNEILAKADATTRAVWAQLDEEVHWTRY